MKEHDAKCRLPARTSEKAQLRKSYFREFQKGEVLRISLPRTRVNKSKEKQLSWMSRGKVLRKSPRSTVFEDGVEDREQLAHAGHQCHLLRFARRQKSLGESPYHRVAARGEQGAHVERPARTSALPPHTLRRPRRVPASRFRGATPTRAATRLCVSVPSSGTPANRVRATTAGPTPGTLRSSASFSPRTGLLSIAASRDRLRCGRAPSRAT